MAEGDLGPQLARLDRAIEREILRLRGRYQLSLDEFRGLYVSDEQVDRLLTEAGAAAPGFAEPASERLATGARHGLQRWSNLVQRFELSPLDEDLLLIAAAPELQPKYETLFAYLNNDVTRKWPTAELARRLVSDFDDVGAVIAALAPSARLQQRGLVRPLAAPATRPSLLNGGFVLDPSVAHFLHGAPLATAVAGRGVTWQGGTELPCFDSLAEQRAASLVRLVSRARHGDTRSPAVALLGLPGSGRRAVAAATAAALDRPLVCVDLDAEDPAGGEVVTTLARLGLLFELVPVVVLLEGFAPAGDEAARLRHEKLASRALTRWPASALVLLRTSEDERYRAYLGARWALELTCNGTSFVQRLDAWKNGAAREGLAIDEAGLRSLAGRFALTPGHVRAALAMARDLAHFGDADGVSEEHIGSAARLVSGHDLGRLARKITKRHAWSDLVLPPRTLLRLRELASAIRHRQVVYGEWGFSERSTSGVGVRALFAGSSGTGKTMAAGIIAAELALDLYQVDLSGIVSKYIGETEKNLDRIFRAAKAANAILFLDEAEAIVGKRSEVKDAHDRYANIEVAYLLQKLEEHDGIVILATNLKGNIDDAFSRRIQYVVDFPRPDEAERERLWRGMFPPTAPLADDVDFDFLARSFELAGGDIRNVALDAAFLALDDGGVIGMRALVSALSRQLAKQGKTPTASDFRQYQRLVPGA